MLRFNDVKSVLFTSDSLRCFKYWSEVLLDYLLMGMFLLVIMSWQNMFRTEYSGLLCVHNEKDNFRLETSEGRYIASRCMIESNAKLTLFYPYFQFLEFILILFTQVIWYNIPKVKAKLDSYCQLLNKIQEIPPKFEQNDACLIPKVVIDHSKEEDTYLIHDKIIFLITEKSFITKFYFYKISTSLLISVLFLCINSFWIYLVTKGGVNFGCDLPYV